jgi:hypothetical protein
LPKAIREGGPLSSVLLTAAAYGRLVGLRLPAADIAAVRRRLPHWWTDTCAEPERTWELASAGQADYVLGELELWVAEHAVDRIFVHAGVVAIGGRALLLPGRSTWGKTTLTAALLAAGAAYGSDEYAVLSPDGRVHPYPRPLEIRDGAVRNRVPAARLGAATLAGPVPVAAVAHLRYQPGSGYQADSVSAGVAVLRLLDNTVCAQSRAAEALDALVAATQGIRAVAGCRGEATSAVPAIRALIGF